MSATWIVPFLETTDFTEDFEDLVLAYIFAKWNITDPKKGLTQITQDKDEIKFHPGMYDFKKTYEICALTGVTTPIEYRNSQRWINWDTEVKVYLRMHRLARDGIDPQLGNMEREVTRIARHYRPNDIPGIDNMWVSMQDRIYLNDDWAQSNWRSYVTVMIRYWKADISDT